MATLLPRQLAKVLYEITKDAKGSDREVALREFLNYVKSQHMMSKMDAIIQAFEMYAKEQDGVVQLQITSAHDISQDVVSTIEKRFGNKVETIVTQDPGLIGGLVVRAGNTIFDGSVKSQLKQIKRTLHT